MFFDLTAWLAYQTKHLAAPCKYQTTWLLGYLAVSSKLCFPFDVQEIRSQWPRDLGKQSLKFSSCPYHDFLYSKYCFQLHTRVHSQYFGIQLLAEVRFDVYVIVQIGATLGQNQWISWHKLRVSHVFCNERKWWSLKLAALLRFLTKTISESNLTNWCFSHKWALTDFI